MSHILKKTKVGDIDPRVSVCVPTYNHKQYIGQCLDGILTQKTDFAYEVLVGEDDSKDGTREICKQYADLYPDRIRLFLNDRKNVIYIDGKPTGRWNITNLLKHARGKYVALCAGDDYWTSPDKLQKQVDLLERRPDVAGCFSNSIIIDDAGQIIADDYFSYYKINVKTEIRTQDIFPYGISPANTLCYRRVVLDNPPNWFTQNIRHSGVDLLITLHGILFCIDEKLGAYRMHAGGIWSRTPLVARLLSDLRFTKPMFFDQELVAKYKAKLNQNRQFLIESLIAEHMRDKKVRRLASDMFKTIVEYKFSVRYTLNILSIACSYCWKIILMLLMRLRRVRK